MPELKIGRHDWSLYLEHRFSVDKMVIFIYSSFFSISTIYTKSTKPQNKK